MRRLFFSCVAGLLTASSAFADPALTIYNQNFAVVRDTLSLDLKPGVNRIELTDLTGFLEPDSVILRDPTGKRSLTILEQFYRADPITQERLLALYEGRTIEFLVQHDNKTEKVKGKIVRSGYAPGQPSPYYGGYAPPSQPLIEVDGQLRFGLPGTPLFPSLGQDVILKPTLAWMLQSDQAGPLTAEFAYVTGQMSWKADYNVTVPEKGDTADLIGWVTFTNRSGKTFENARIKLMAGDVNKIEPRRAYADAVGYSVNGAMAAPTPPVTEKSFDEFHLYTLQRPTTLRDQETKQVEFVRGEKMRAKRIYVYNGAKIDENRYRGWGEDSIRQNAEYGTQSNPKVWVMQEIANTRENGLGMPLPKGRLRFYRRDADGRLEFTGENVIDHTPQGETLRVYTGNAFDIVGERRRTEYKVDTSRRTIDESFEIKVRNRKREPVEVRIVETLYRGLTWEIPTTTDQFVKKDSRTAEFTVTIAPDQEKTVVYTAHYTW